MLLCIALLVFDTSKVPVMAKQIEINTLSFSYLNLNCSVPTDYDFYSLSLSTLHSDLSTTAISQSPYDIIKSIQWWLS